MRYTRFIGATTACGIAAVVLAGCAGGTASSTESKGEDVELTVTWWGSEERIAKYEEAFEIFEEEHPGVEITGTPSDYSSYWTSRSTEAAARTLPDVMQFDQANLAEYAGNGLLLDLSAYEGDQLDLSGVDEVKLAAGQLDGKQYSVPTGSSVLSLFINPALAEKAGVEPLDADYTWEELDAWAAEVTAAGAVNDEGQPIYGSLGYTHTMFVFAQWLLQKGIEPFGDDGSFGFTEDDIVEFLELSQPAREEGAYYPSDRSTQVAPLDGFAMNEVASALVWDNYFARYAPETGEDLIMLPVPSGEDGDKAMFYTVQHLAVAANTAHPEEAAELTGFLMSDPRVAEIFGTDRGIPVVDDALEALSPEEGSIDDKVIAYEESIAEDATEATPLVPTGFATLEAEWVRLSGELAYGNITPEEFASQWWAEAEMAVG